MTLLQNRSKNRSIMKKLLLFFIFIIDLVFNPFCNFIISSKERWTSFTWNNLWYFFCEITTVFLRTLIAEEACLFFRFSAKYYFKKNMKSKKYIVLHAKKNVYPGIYHIYFTSTKILIDFFVCHKIYKYFSPFSCGLWPRWYNKTTNIEYRLIKYN